MQPTNLVEMQICLLARSPLLLGGGLPIGNVRLSDQFVAGSVWRGAIARAILERLGLRNHRGQAQPNPTLPAPFLEIFGKQAPAAFGFLYPLLGERSQTNTWTAGPIPLTARTCKRHPGFQQPQEHGVYDGLLNSLRAVEHPTQPNGGLRQCPIPDCRERLERIRGFTSAPMGTAAYQQEKLGTRSLVRVGLNRYTETAQDQMLYVQDVLEPGHEKDGSPKALTFVGHWRGSAQQATLFHDLLQTYLLPAVTEGFQLRIGSARARGLGAVDLQVTAPTPLSATTQRAAIEQRVDDLTGRLAPPSTTQADAPAYLYATLTLRTPVQLLDEWGASTTQLTEPLLQAYYPALPAGLKILSCSVLEQEITGGWSAAWGLPKPLGPALAAGSVVALRVPQQERQAFLDFLTTVAQTGLGERRAEGWGELLVCDQFHLEYDERQAQVSKEAGQ